MSLIIRQEYITAVISLGNIFNVIIVEIVMDFSKALRKNFNTTVLDMTTVVKITTDVTTSIVLSTNYLFMNGLIVELRRILQNSVVSTLRSMRDVILTEGVKM